MHGFFYAIVIFVSSSTLSHHQSWRFGGRFGGLWRLSRDQSRSWTGYCRAYEVGQCDHCNARDRNRIRLNAACHGVTIFHWRRERLSLRYNSGFTQKSWCSLKQFSVSWNIRFLIGNHYRWQSTRRNAIIRRFPQLNGGCAAGGHGWLTAQWRFQLRNVKLYLQLYCKSLQLQAYGN